MSRIITGLGILLAALACAAPSFLNATVLLQQDSNYLAFEAEQYSSLTAGTGGAAWSVITTTSGTNLLPANTTAVGSALYNHSGGSENAFATYTLNFTSDGSYYLYSRYSFFERNNTGDYGNEDSFYTPGAFGQAAETAGTWNIQHLPTLGHNPTTNPNDGQKFYWDVSNTLDSGSPAVIYEISGASEASPVEVTFTIRSRESGVALDRFIFIKETQPLTGGDSAFLNSISSVPEPSKTLLLAAAFMGLIFLRRR